MEKVTIFISVIRKDNQISTWTTLKEVVFYSEEELLNAVNEIIDEVKVWKKWVGGKIEKIKIHTNEGVLIYNSEEDNNDNFPIEI